MHLRRPFPETARSINGPAIKDIKGALPATSPRAPSPLVSKGPSHMVDQTQALLSLLQQQKHREQSGQPQADEAALGGISLKSKLMGLLQ